jgi:hypothetical protein
MKKINLRDLYPFYKKKNLPDEKWAGLVHTVNAATRIS